MRYIAKFLHSGYQLQDSHPAIEKYTRPEWMSLN